MSFLSVFFFSWILSRNKVWKNICTGVWQSVKVDLASNWWYFIKCWSETLQSWDHKVAKLESGLRQCLIQAPAKSRISCEARQGCLRPLFSLVLKTSKNGDYTALYSHTSRWEPSDRTLFASVQMFMYMFIYNTQESHQIRQYVILPECLNMTGHSVLFRRHRYDWCLLDKPYIRLII